MKICHVQEALPHALVGLHAWKDFHAWEGLHASEVLCGPLPVGPPLFPCLLRACHLLQALGDGGGGTSAPLLLGLLELLLLLLHGILDSFVSVRHT